MIDDDLTKKLAEAAKKVLANDNTNDKSDDGEGLDKVQPKAVKKKFDDRKDKDIDNDGDVDSSDEYLHKRRKAISKATKEETELEEATELFKKGKITLTKFAMGKGKGVGLQINYGTKFIQVPEKDIKQLYTAMVYVTKSVPQFKESVEIDEGIFNKLNDKLNPKKAKAREALAKMAQTKEKLQAAKDKFLDKAKNATNRINDIENNAGDYEDPDQEIQDVRDIAGSHRFDAEEVQKKIVIVSKKMAEISKKFGVRTPTDESVEVKEGFYYDNMSPKEKKRLNSIYKEMDKNEKETKAAIKKGDAKKVDKLGNEYHKLRMQVVNFYNEDVDLEEASKDWEVVVTMGVNKLKKGQKTVVKARNSAEAIKKAAKEFNINDKLITGKVDANLKEEVELQEGRFDKLQKKLGRINPESLEAVMSGKIKLNPAEKKEFDEFMKGVRKMFASTNY